MSTALNFQFSGLLLMVDFITHHSQQYTQMQVNLLMYNTSLMPIHV